MMIVPPVTLIQLAPVSLAGWGVRKAALVVVLGLFGGPGRGGAGDLGSGRSLSDLGGLARRFDLAWGLGHCTITYAEAPNLPRFRLAPKPLRRLASKAA
jgi:hypothetical protein